MENYFFVNQAIVPVRGSASDTSEMVTQLLFGDSIQLLERNAQWMKIHSNVDGYDGWIDSKMVIPAVENDLWPILTWRFVAEPAVAFETSEGTLHLTAGCRIPPDAVRRQIGDWWIDIPADYNPPQSMDVVEISARYLNAPYLWGGKTLWGIDCSGLTQMVFAAAGKQLPRDASEQCVFGDPKDFADRHPGDVAFFSNDQGRINHVGIVLADNKIRHASGIVHDDLLTAEGIVNMKTKELTHKLHNIASFFS